MSALYSMTGTVAHGKGVGHALGFPTANIAYPAAGQRPPDGVYLAEVELMSSGRRLCGVLNQGAHPTLAAGAPTVEVHLLDFSGDLYGQTVRVDYVRFLRPETRFLNMEALRDQLKRDAENARAYFDAHGLTPRAKRGL